jgi:hypothetical protein
MINMIIVQTNNNFENKLENVEYRPTINNEESATLNEPTEFTEKGKSEKPKIKLKILLQIGVDVSDYCQNNGRQPYYRIDGVA